MLLPLAAMAGLAMGTALVAQTEGEVDHGAAGAVRADTEPAPAFLAEINSLAGTPADEASLHQCLLTVTSRGPGCPGTTAVTITAALDLGGLRKRPGLLGMFGKQHPDVYIIDVKGGELSDRLKLRYSPELSVLQERLSALPREARTSVISEDLARLGIEGRYAPAIIESAYCDGRTVVRHMDLYSSIMSLKHGVEAEDFLDRFVGYVRERCM